MLVTVGTRVSEGQPVMELETDKAVVEVRHSVGGVVREIKVKEGQKVKVGQVIFTLEGGASAPTAPPNDRLHPSSTSPDSKPLASAFNSQCRRKGRRKSKRFHRISHRHSQFQHLPCPFSWAIAGTEHREPVPAAPHVRRLAREIGVDIHDVKGSGIPPGVSAKTT